MRVGKSECRRACHVSLSHVFPPHAKNVECAEKGMGTLAAAACTRTGDTRQARYGRGRIPVTTDRLASSSWAADEERSHVEWEIDDAIFYLNIFYMKDKWRIKNRSEFGAEFVERYGRIFASAFYLDRRDVALPLRAGSCSQKIDLHPVFILDTVRVGIKIKFVSGGTKHLRNDIFDKHSLVELNVTA